MANFTKSIIRGAGNEIGRSIARNAINKVSNGSDANYVNINAIDKSDSKVTREVVKACKFEFSGSKQTTIENKLFNLLNKFEESINITNIPYLMGDIKLIESKINDIYDFFRFREFETNKLDVLKSKFFLLCKQSIEIIKEHHSIQLENLEEKLTKTKRNNKIKFILGFTILPFLPLVFIKKTSKIKDSIEYHMKIINNCQDIFNYIENY